MKKLSFYALLLGILPSIGYSQNATKRNLKPKDVYQIKTVSDAKISPDGAWVSYTLTSVDSVKNKRSSDVWMVSWDGKESIQLTNSPDGESQAKWSPDNKYISFVSARNSSNGSQIWLLDRRGGEGKQLTTLKGGDLQEYAWSPDGKKIAVVLESKADTSKPKTPKPIVIDRFLFKKDVEGYRERTYSNIYLLDVVTKKIDTLTKGNYEVSSIAWSPDGTKIAFVSNRTPDPDRNENTDIFVIEAKSKSEAKQLTTWTGSDNAPVWSPDSKTIAYLRSSASEDYIMYDHSVLCTINANGGEPTLLSKNLDRPVNTPRWAKDGQSIYALVVDDRYRYLANFSLTGTMKKTSDDKGIYSSLESHPYGNWLSLVTTPELPAEIYAIENGQRRALTNHHEAFFKQISLATVEGFTSKSKDGATVSSILYRPANVDPKKKLPTIFFIHGGPVAQDEFGFDLSRQMLASAGYAVVGVNYRGSNGRGLEYCKVISGDWGNKEVLDILGAVDYTVKNGIADPEKLGIGGWSYGGILTDYTIATDTRFKAAASGAGVAMISSMYGVDQYILQYEHEIGSPWKNFDKYVKLSYPFLKADKIKTPTQFMVGESDHNVPAVGSEQMYQALRTIGIPTELIVYPGQFHGISVPSYQVDRFERYIKWFDKYLK
ncbi:MAG: prolyl oligopeptidase family serine peptidase [Flectobacillus sp.]|uniref:prolyl oligopeptidase family serine peptidase n=1 Tax=Flectobacillus sp. TaxID=50419 RepID=UPI003B99D155